MKLNEETMLDACKACGCKTFWKAGIIKGKQRYRCKNCKKAHSETDARVKYSEEEHQYAFGLYLKGCGFQRIAKIMGESFGKKYLYQTIKHWIKRAGLIKNSDRENKK